MQHMPMGCRISGTGVHAAGQDSHVTCQKVVHLEAEVVGQDAALGQSLVALADHTLRSEHRRGLQLPDQAL